MGLDQRHPGDRRPPGRRRGHRQRQSRDLDPRVPHLLPFDAACCERSPFPEVGAPLQPRRRQRELRRQTYSEGKPVCRNLRPHGAGIRDIIAEQTNRFEDPKGWEARGIALAHEVRDEIRRQDRVTCRSWYAAAAIRPPKARGQANHALLRERRVTCVNCHFSLVYGPVPPGAVLIHGSVSGGDSG